MEYSKYVQIFEEAGYKVIRSHIDEEKNFFYYEPEEHYDIINERIQELEEEEQMPVAQLLLEFIEENATEEQKEEMKNPK
jgi:hypothetical protein